MHMGVVTSVVEYKFSTVVEVMNCFFLVGKFFYTKEFGTQITNFTVVLQ